MNGLRGIFAGVLALAALQRLLGSDKASNRVGGLFLDVGRLAQRALSADVPTFGPAPDTTTAPTSGRSPAGGTGTAQLAPRADGGFSVTPLPSSVPAPQIAPGWRPSAPNPPATVYPA